MKKEFLRNKLLQIRQAYYGKIFLVVIIALSFSFYSNGQTDSSAAEESDDEIELISPSVDFVAVQKSDNTLDLKATVRAKVNGSLTNLHSLKVKFYHVTDSSEKEIGAAITNRSGLAVMNIKAGDITVNNEGIYHLKVSVPGNKSMESGEEELSIKKAKLVVTPVLEDSVPSLSISLIDESTGEEKPIAEAEIGVFVKRLFKPLPIGTGTTDETGETSIEIPAELPGDAEGNIQFIVRLDDDETYGNLEAHVTEKWGIPVSDEILSQPRALWSSNPPLWMLITFIILMAVVWGHYIVIVYELFRLRKEEPIIQSDATKP